MKNRRTLGGIVATALLILAIPIATTAFANPPPSDCVAGAESQTCPAKAITEHECNDEELHFVITQIDEEANAPASITVTYVGGAVEVIPLSAFTGGTAHYATTTTGGTVESASAVIYLAWSGQFNLSHGLCEEPPTTETTAPPTSETTTSTTSPPPPPPPPPTTSTSTTAPPTTETTAPPTTSPPDTCCVVTTTKPAPTSTVNVGGPEGAQVIERTAAPTFTG